MFCPDKAGADGRNSVRRASDLQNHQSCSSVIAMLPEQIHHLELMERSNAATGSSASRIFGSTARALASSTRAFFLRTGWGKDALQGEQAGPLKRLLDNSTIFRRYASSPDVRQAAQGNDTRNADRPVCGTGLGEVGDAAGPRLILQPV